ncbi:FtsX-like permease family protein [Streptomyces iconiensis]|uniref:FtsX-like permease family protein n=1 Tax=Streptomyces iconiensis TaxID=1384038 RepID=A0ABT6ZZN4_9ACTN|nr:ABC transporter permease [Streptomyces iconiensis]MDJ1134540.1 FtsX-like permease family protein [Streptomyces iconiensis]
MLTLAWRSVRHRPARLIATLLAAFLGSAITMMFNSLHDTAAASGVDARSSESLSLTGGVVGGYGTLLVFFAIASTLTVNVRQREAEMHLLRCTGATPGQIRRMVTGEAAAVALLGVLLAIVPAMLGGQALVAEFRDTGQVAGNVEHTFGPVALGAGLAVTLVSAVGAAALAVRRAAKAAEGRRPRARLRTAGGLLALVAGVGSMGTAFSMDAKDSALMAPAAYGSILLSLGFAVFSPALLRVLLVRFSRPVSALTGGGGYIAVRNLRRRAEQLTGILMPLMLFVGIATATLYLQGIESDAITASGMKKSVEDKNLETVNLVVVGIIVVFACVMLINTLYATTAYRSREFGRQRLAGATPRQVLATVATESLVLVVTGVFFGTLAAFAGILTFTSVRTDETMPSGQGPGIWLTIAALAVTATFVTSLITARRTLRTPAVEAVAVAA